MYFLINRNYVLWLKMSSNVLITINNGINMDENILRYLICALS